MSNDLIWAAVRVLVALPLVLLMAYLVLKYGLAKRYAATPGKNRMKLVEQLPLGPKTVLSLVGLGEKYYLLAHQDNSIQLIKELDELPLQEKIVVEEVMELTPRAIKEIDQNRGTGKTGETGPIPGRLKKGKYIFKAGLVALDKLRSQVASHSGANMKHGNKPDR
ncbi:flagellar biosynthetic protein FliO [Pelotomaculum isophthalicicum JI]|uniref:Flagellar biosynthetic protein FliO n=1 Tax=Pelotomaculum isophthalicicum JI TaxID=947010 RepID=A0A9X4JW11_9FIRM|nr:flagellar biosynthetic protein FliO [Pelotomaculum isophthalicicum]MDF9409311.1 flagellar biosynthetic protein FliO [Pelotomaculum isophthalicicum JI]